MQYGPISMDLFQEWKGFTRQSIYIYSEIGQVLSFDYSPVNLYPICLILSMSQFQNKLGILFINLNCNEIKGCYAEASIQEIDVSHSYYSGTRSTDISNVVCHSFEVTANPIRTNCSIIITKKLSR